MWSRVSVDTGERNNILEWAGSCEKVPSNMYKMCRLRLSGTCAKYHPGLCSPVIHSVVSNDSVSEQEGADKTARMRRRLIWAFAYAPRHVFAWFDSNNSEGVWKV